MGAMRNVLAATAASLMCATAWAASDYYLKLDGVKGESAAQSNEVQSWSWGATQSGAYGHGTGSTGRAQAPAAPVAAPVVAPRDKASGMATGKRTAVAAGDLDGDGAADVAVAAEPQLDAVNEVTLRLRESPTLPKSMRQGCAAGTHFGSVELGGKGKRYQMHDAVATACTVTDGMRTITLKGHVTLIK